MLSIKNLIKTYKSKKGLNQIALNDLSINFDKTGFVCILGKSGSGKSTLLNLLGGLDTPSSGDIYINGQSISSFTKKELDYYRSGYIGFVFQDFNIIDDLTVYENVSLPLELQRKDQTYINELVMDLLSSLGIKEYANRKTNELSGGQIQRVAIARALVKDPKVILADEPTGNLDSESSLDALKLLKEQSKSKLVIMVTHDKETADTFGDRVIELKDGRVINDYINNGKQSEVIEVVTNDIIVEKLPIIDEDISYKDNPFELKKSKFPNISALKMAIANLMGSKIRFTFTLMLFAVTLVLFGVTALVANYDSNYSTSKSFQKSDINHYDLQYCSGDLDLDRTLSCLTYSSANSRLYDDSQLDNLRLIENINIYPKVDYNLEVIPEVTDKESGRSYIKTYIYEPTYFTDFIAVNDDNHFTLLDGRWAKSPSEVVISDFMADYLYKIYQNSSEYNLEKPSDIINKHIESPNSDVKLTISGIFETDYKKYEDLFNIKIGSILNKEDNERMNEFLIKRDTFYIALMVTEEKFSNPFEAYIAGFINTTNRKYRINFKNYDQLLKYYDNASIYPENIDVTSLNDDEAIIYASDLSKLFNLLPEDVKNLRNDITLFDKYLNQTVKIIPHTSSKKSLDEIVEYKVVGILNDTTLPDFYINVMSDDVDLLVNQKFMDKITLNKSYFNGLVAYYHGNANTNSEFLETANNNNFIHSTDLSVILYTYEKTSEQLLPLLISVSIALGIFTVILINSFISFSITNKKKEIGILRAMGTKSKDVSKIFILQALIIGILSALLAITIVSFGANEANNIISRDLRLQLYIYNTGIFEVLLILFLSITIVYFSSLFTTKLITKKQPIDAIRDK